MANYRFLRDVTPCQCVMSLCEPVRVSVVRGVQRSRQQKYSGVILTQLKPCWSERCRFTILKMEQTRDHQAGNPQSEGKEKKYGRRGSQWRQPSAVDPFAETKRSGSQAKRF